MPTSPVTPEFIPSPKKPKQFGLMPSGTKGFQVTRVDSARANFMTLREASAFAPKDLTTDSAIIRQQPVVFSSGVELARALEAQGQVAPPRERSLSSRIFASGSMKLFGLAATVIRGAEDLLIAAVKPQIDDVANATRAVCGMSPGTQKMCRAAADLGKQALVKSGAVDAAKAVHSACVKGVEIYAERNEALHGIPKEETRQFARDIGKVFLYATPWAIAKEFQYAAAATKTAAVAVESGEAVAAPLALPAPALSSPLGPVQFIRQNEEAFSVWYTKAIHPMPTTAPFDSGRTMTLFLEHIEAAKGVKAAATFQMFQTLRQAAFVEGATKLFVQLDGAETRMRNIFGRRFKFVGEESHFHRLDPTSPQRFPTYEVSISQPTRCLNRASETLPIARIESVIGEAGAVTDRIRLFLPEIKSRIPDYTRLRASLEEEKWLASIYQGERDLEASSIIRLEAMGENYEHFKLVHGDLAFSIRTASECQEALIAEYYASTFLQSLNLKHLHIPMTYGIGRDGKVIFMAQSFIPGRRIDTISQQFHKFDPLSTERRELIAEFSAAGEQLGKGLAGIHNEGLLAQVRPDRGVLESHVHEFRNTVEEARVYLREIDSPLDLPSADRFAALANAFLEHPGDVSYTFGAKSGSSLNFIWDSASAKLTCLDCKYIARSISSARKPTGLVAEDYAIFLRDFDHMDMDPREIYSATKAFTKGYSSEFRGSHSSAATDLFWVREELEVIAQVARDLAGDAESIQFSMKYIVEDIQRVEERISKYSGATSKNNLIDKPESCLFIF